MSVEVQAEVVHQFLPNLHQALVARRSRAPISNTQVSGSAMEAAFDRASLVALAGALGDEQANASPAELLNGTLTDVDDNSAPAPKGRRCARVTVSRLEVRARRSGYVRFAYHQPKRARPTPKNNSNKPKRQTINP
jgi:hypothetical protein